MDAAAAAVGAAAAQQHTNHACGPSCTVEALFGNAYRCLSSGMVHICDRNCDQRIQYGSAHTICVISKRLGPPLGGGLGGAQDEPPQHRKRTTGGGGAEVQQQQQHQHQQQQQQQQLDLDLELERQASKRGRVST